MKTNCFKIAVLAFFSFFLVSCGSDDSFEDKIKEEMSADLININDKYDSEDMSIIMKGEQIISKSKIELTPPSYTSSNSNEYGFEFYIGKSANDMTLAQNNRLDLEYFNKYYISCKPYYDNGGEKIYGQEIEPKTFYCIPKIAVNTHSGKGANGEMANTLYIDEYLYNNNGKYEPIQNFSNIENLSCKLLIGNATYEVQDSCYIKMSDVKDKLGNIDIYGIADNKLAITVIRPVTTDFHSVVVVALKDGSTIETYIDNYISVHLYDNEKFVYVENAFENIKNTFFNIKKINNKNWTINDCEGLFKSSSGKTEERISTPQGGYHLATDEDWQEYERHFGVVSENCEGMDKPYGEGTGLFEALCNDFLLFYSYDDDTRIHNTTDLKYPFNPSQSAADIDIYCYIRTSTKDDDSCIWRVIDPINKCVYRLKLKESPQNHICNFAFFIED